MKSNHLLTLYKKAARLPCYCFLIVPASLLLLNVSTAGVVGTHADPIALNKVLICHVPEGDFSKAHTITTSVTELNAHLTHDDDYEGACVAPGIAAPAVECAAPLGTNLRFNFANPTQITNQGAANLGQVGTIFRFDDVTTDIDAFVTVLANQNATLLQIDVPSAEESATGTGLKWALQPEIQPTNQVAGKYYIDFLISFVKKNSIFPSQTVKNGSFLATVADIDSDGFNSHLKELVELNRFNHYVVENVNMIDSYVSTLSGTSRGFESRTAANLDGITVFNTSTIPKASEHIVTFQYQQESFFRYRAGINFTDTYIDTADARLFSLFFNCPDFNNPVSSVDPVSSADYGDAPSSYGDASHTLPAAPNNPTIYLGSLFPDAESLSLNTANSGADGTGDDVDGTDDEDGISSFPALYSDVTSYTLPLTAITTSNQSGVNSTLYGYIDFNQDGDFNDAGETATAVVNQGATQPATDLVWSGFATLTTGSTYARFRISTDNGLSATGLASDGEVEDYNTVSITVPPSCSALSGDINGGLSTTTKLAMGDSVFLASSTLASATGHLKAYRVDKKGLPETELWDAATAMDTQDERATRLFSTASDGTKLLFSSLDNAFLSSGTPDGQTIKNTVAAALMGSVSPQSNVAVINNAMNAGLYLTDNAYKAFYNTTVSKRAATHGANKPSRVLVSSDDGFLYAFDQYNGELGWGWIPRTVAQAMQSASFATNHLMQGKINIMDIKSASGYASYVVGSYKNGLGHYVLKLGSDSSLDEVVWDTDHTTDASPATSTPNQGQPAYFSDVNGTLYMAYVITDVANVSTLHIRNIIDASVHEKITLTFTATSMPYVIRDFGSSYAPAKKTLYLGDSLGTIHAAGLLTVTGTVGVLETTATLTAELNNTTVAALNSTDSSPVLFIGAAGSSTHRAFYLHAQSSDRLTVFQYDANNTAWQADWTSYIGGAGAWVNGSSSLTAKATIQALPTGAILTDNAFVVANSIVLPVSLTTTNNGCYNEAFYYFYKLADGSIPTQTFLKTSDKSFIGGSISLGKGNARALQMSKIKGDHLRLGFGMADQKTDVTTVSGINKTFYINEPSAKVLRGRKELRK